MQFHSKAIISQRNAVMQYAGLLLGRIFSDGAQRNEFSVHFLILYNSRQVADSASYRRASRIAYAELKSK